MIRTWIGLLFVIPLFAQDEAGVKTPMDLLDYPDSIAVVTILKFNAQFTNGDTIRGRESGKTELRYDKSGRLSHWLNYSSTGSMYFGYEYLYSADGKIVTKRDAEDSTDVDEISYYDDQSRLIRISSWSAGHREMEFRYSGAGVLQTQTEYRYYAKDGSIDSKLELEYNEKGLVEKSTYYVLYGKGVYDVCSTTWYTYDSMDRQLERRWTDYHGWIYYTETFVYNEKGQITKNIYASSKHHATGEFWNETTYTYDGSGNLSSERYRNKYNDNLTTFAIINNASGLPMECLTISEGSGTFYVWSYTSQQ